MIDFQAWASGSKTMEEVLNKAGVSGGVFSDFCDAGLRNLKFLVIMNFLTEEEAQIATQRIIAYIVRTVFM